MNKHLVGWLDLSLNFNKSIHSLKWYPTVSDPLKVFVRNVEESLRKRNGRIVNMKKVKLGSSFDHLAIPKLAYLLQFVLFR